MSLDLTEWPSSAEEGGGTFCHFHGINASAEWPVSSFLVLLLMIIKSKSDTFLTLVDLGHESSPRSLRGHAVVAQSSVCPKASAHSVVSDALIAAHSVRRGEPKAPQSLRNRMLQSASTAACVIHARNYKMFTTKKFAAGRLCDIGECVTASLCNRPQQIWSHDQRRRLSCYLSPGTVELDQGQK